MSRNRKLVLKLAFTCVALLTLTFSALSHSTVQAIGTYDNAKIADKALTYVGQNEGQCRSFVDMIVSEVGGQNIHVGSSDYFDSFTRAGGIHITDESSLVKGDIVQIGQFDTDPLLHTFIIVSHVSGNTYNVVDSNHKENGIVMNYNRDNIVLGSDERAYQMGTVNGGSTSAAGATNPSSPIASNTSVSFNVNGHANLMMLHGLADGGANLYQFNESTGSNGPGLVQTFPASAGWNWNDMKVATGDANGDGSTDLFMLHKLADGGFNFYVFYGGNGHYAETAPVKNFPGSAGWSWANTKMLVGDYAGDGRSDLMLLTETGDGGANMYIYNANTGFTGPGLIENFPGSAGWNWNEMKVATGDVNNDGVSDLLMLHKLADGGFNFYVFYGGAGQFAETAPVKEFPGSAGWSWANTKMLVGDFTGSHNTDLMLLTETGDGGANMYIYNQAQGFNGPGLIRNFPESAGWNWNDMKVSTGDVNGDGVSDLLMLHKLADGGANFYVFYGGAGQFANTNPAATFPESAGWNWNEMLAPIWGNMQTPAD